MTASRTMTEYRWSEPASESDPYELSAHDHNVLTRAVSFYLDHLDRVFRETKHYGGQSGAEMSRARNNLDALYDRICASSAIFIHPEE